MPALTHGRVRNGFNSYSTDKDGKRIQKKGMKPVNKNTRFIKGMYNADALRKNAIVGNTGQSFDAKRAAARTTKVTENPCEKNCLPTVQK